MNWPRSIMRRLSPVQGNKHVLLRNLEAARDQLVPAAAALLSRCSQSQPGGR